MSGGRTKWLRIVKWVSSDSREPRPEAEKASHKKGTKWIFYHPEGTGDISCPMPIEWEWPRDVGKKD